MKKLVIRDGKSFVVDMTEEEASERLQEQQVADAFEAATRYAHDRRASYPEIGMQLDADYKNRQKARMWAGKALKSLQDGDLAMAINHLIEAMQPCDESDEIDGKINSIKKKHPKQEVEE